MPLTGGLDHAVATIPSNALTGGLDHPIEFISDSALTGGLDHDVAVSNEVEQNFEVSTEVEASLAKEVSTENTVQFSPEAEADFIASELSENIIQFSPEVEASISPTVAVSNILEFNTSAELEFVPFETNIILYGSDNHAINSIGVQGGGSDFTKRIITNNVQSLTPIQFASSNDTDVSQRYLIEGLSDFNLKLSEIIELDGLNPVQTSKKFAYIFRITKLSGNPLKGSVTITNPNTVTIGVLQSLNNSFVGIETKELINLFAEVPSNPTKEKTVYEKFFLKNVFFDQLTVILSEHADPEDCATFALEPTKNSTISTQNRELRPVAIPLRDFTSLPKQIVLDPGDTIGVWVRVFIAAGHLFSSKIYDLKLGFGRYDKIVRLIGRRAGGNNLEQAVNIRNSHPLIGGGNPLNFVELKNGKMVTELFYEPDPETFRDQFYYNSRLNRLYKKLDVKPKKVWKLVR